MNYTTPFSHRPLKSKGKGKGQGDTNTQPSPGRERSRRPAHTWSAPSASFWWTAGAWATSRWQAQGHTMEPHAGSTCQGASVQGAPYDIATTYVKLDTVGIMLFSIFTLAFVLVGTCIYACRVKKYGENHSDSGDSDSDTMAAPARARLSKLKAEKKSKAARGSSRAQRNLATWDDGLFINAFVTSYGTRVHLQFGHVQNYAPYCFEIPVGAVKAFNWCKVCAHENAVCAVVQKTVKDRYGPQAATKHLEILRAQEGETSNADEF